MSNHDEADLRVRTVAAANPRTVVVVVNSGAPVLLPWAGDVGAVLLTWFGGQEFGNALADVLLGEAEPGGRLPTTAFQHWADGGWTLEAGTFALAAGSSCACLPPTASVTLT